MKRILLGVGNRLLGDDGIGPEVVRQVQGSDWVAIDGGSAPENVIGLVAGEHPDLLVIVDAARMGLPPGTFRRLPLTATDRMLASTHGLPLSFLIDCLGGSASKIVLIGVDPEDRMLAEGLSGAARAAVERLTHLLSEGRIEAIPPL